MMTPKKLFLKFRNKSFRGDERGGVTIEFVLWAPVFAALIAGATDISLAFMNQSNFWNVARDTARIVSRHGMDADEAKAYAEANAIFGNATPTALVTIDTDVNEVIVTITAPATTIDAFGIFGIFKDTVIKAEVRHNLEPR
jgi:Flp pilus assembly protein TadG